MAPDLLSSVPHPPLARNFGQRVLLIDADPQGSAITWAAIRNQRHDNNDGDILFPVVSLTTDAIQKEIKLLGKDFDSVIIDGPPRINKVVAATIMASDMVVVPIQPSAYDIWATEEINEMIEMTKETRPELKSGFAINLKIRNSVLGRDVHDALEKFPRPILKSEVCSNMAFKRSVGAGKTVLQTAPKSEAAREIMELANELLEAADE
ncbi:MAG: ParA family partition ATPase [Planctomycetota bacterium]